MKLLIRHLPLFLSTALLFLIVPFSVHGQSKSLSIVSYNIRYANEGDAPNTWNARKDKVFSLIREAKPDVFGLQEALFSQVTDVEKAFPTFARIGVGRDDGKNAGEFSPLFYNTSRFQLLASGTFWLSQTPAVAGSRGWDAACNRVVTWLKLSDKTNNKDILVFCTHFDHMGEVARRNSASLLLHAVDSLSGTNPAVVIGDFNATPDSEPYKIITSGNGKLIDARTKAKSSDGPLYTYTGFKVGEIKGEQIDYVFLKGITEVKSIFVNEHNSGGYYPSDHLPVNAVLNY